MVRHTRATTATPTRPIDSARSETLAFALAYADAGWPVFPVRPGSKRPATPNHPAADCDLTDPRCACSGSHQGWEQRATTDHDRITQAWTTQPWGIGIACGPAGLIVVDLDIPKTSGATGAESLRQLEHEHRWSLPRTFTVATPSGGRHLYYRRPARARIGNSAGTVGPGIDIRAAGGYVVAPPTTINSRTYDVIDDAWPVELPDWFAQLLTPPAPANPTPVRPPIDPNRAGQAEQVRRYVQAAVENEARDVANAAPGRRSHVLNKAAYSLGGLVGADHLDRCSAEAALEQAASCHYGISGPTGAPFTAAEARATIASGLQSGINKPRQLSPTSSNPARTNQ